MAKVVVDKRIIQREQVIPAKTEKEVVLTLRQAEAEALFSLMGQCKSGGVTSPIYNALCGARISSSQYSVNVNGIQVGTIELTKRDDLW